MGVLIVIGVVVVAVTIVKRSTRLAETPASAGFGRAEIGIPAGSRVAETVIDGNRMVLRLVLADGRTRMVVVDMRTGRRTGAIDLRPQPPGARGN